MGSYSDYLEPTREEKEASKLLCLLDEMETGAHVDPAAREWHGFHGGAFNRAPTAHAIQTMEEELSSLCRDRGVEGRSLEMQIWWRDHQKMAEQRKKSEHTKKPAFKECSVSPNISPQFVGYIVSDSSYSKSKE